jgi:hypothetical protein
MSMYALLLVALCFKDDCLRPHEPPSSCPRDARLLGLVELSGLSGSLAQPWV